MEVGEGVVEATRHVYPAAAMVGDYLRAAAGLVPSAILFAIVPVGGIAWVVLGGMGVIFAIFGLRTVLRHGTSLEMSETELCASGLLRRRTIRWAELDRMRLAYYSTRRDRKSGWMQLELRAGRARLSLDSRLDGFERVVRQAAAAAAERRIELSGTSAANLEALGIRVPEAWVAR
jgi:hypothetical protein